MNKTKLKEVIRKLESALVKSKDIYLAVENELAAEKKIHAINKQALTSCENANAELQAINRYLEMTLHEKIRNE